MGHDAARQHRILRQHVETDRLLGVEAIPLGSPPEVPQEVPPEVPQEVPPESVPARTQAFSVRPLDGEGGDKAVLLAAMDEHEVKVCTKCVLCQGRIQTVFGDGDPDADLMFIGEGPGQHEDEQGVPFVGPAGALLEKMIVAMGLSRRQVFITNVVKCRPPNNRTPGADEVAACSDFLHRQIGMIVPKVIVTLGGPAAKLMLGTQAGITRIRGGWHEYQPPSHSMGAIPLMPTFHPAFLLRQYTTDNRKKVWSDLQQVMAKLENNHKP